LLSIEITERVPQEIVEGHQGLTQKAIVRRVIQAGMIASIRGTQVQVHTVAAVAEVAVVVTIDGEGEAIVETVDIMNTEEEMIVEDVIRAEANRTC
jgi:predicted hotdog family 3-hydroxylacyl-ACP dehydratase